MYLPCLTDGGKFSEYRVFPFFFWLWLCVDACGI